MSGLLVLLGLSAYFILTSTFPLSDSLHFLNDVVGANNISNSRPVVTDASANDYLTLLSAPFDVDNPNPVENGYIRDDSDGQYPENMGIISSHAGDISTLPSCNQDASSCFYGKPFGS